MEKDQLLRLLRGVSPPNTPESAARIRELLLANGVDPAYLHQNMEMSARYVDAHLDISFPGDTVAPHSHPFHELICCLSEEIDCLVGSEQYSLRRGDILYIPAGTVHAPLIPEQMTAPYRRYVLWISPEYARLITTLFMTDPFPDKDATCLIRSGGASGEFLSQYFRRCAQECQQRQFRHDAVVFGIVMDLSVQLARFMRSESHDAPDKPELIDQIIHHVEAHLSERITVADVAARFWVSQSTVSQLFRKKLGISFYRYVTQRRLLEARLLIRSGVPMEQVSIAVGFQDYSSFYRAFRAEFGQSPAQFRKELS